MSEKLPVIHSDPEILGGTPVFVGTRVPVQALLDYFEGGHNLKEFLDDFPTVSQQQAIAVLEVARGAPGVKDPIFGLGQAPVTCGVPDSSIRHDHYLYDSRE